jgi:hypothetical protein
MLDAIRPVLSRIIGSLVAGLAVWLTGKFGVVIDDNAKAKLTEAGVVASLTIFSIVYSLVHKAIDHKINPLDTASPSLSRPKVVRSIRQNYGGR